MYNKLNDHDVKYLAQILRTNTTLTALYLNHNEFGSDGLYAIGEMLQFNTTLKRINLTGDFMLCARDIFMNQLKKNVGLIFVIGHFQTKSIEKRNITGHKIAAQSIQTLLLIRKKLTLKSKIANLLHQIPKEIVLDIVREMWRHKGAWVKIVN